MISDKDLKKGQTVVDPWHHKDVTGTVISVKGYEVIIDFGGTHARYEYANAKKFLSARR